MFIPQEPAMLQSGNAEDFRMIYNATMPVLFRVSFRIAGSEAAAEDLCHEAYIKMYEKEMQFPSMNDAKYWLIRVIKNGSLNYAKRKECERRAYEKALREDTRKSESGETTLLKKDAQMQIQEALAKLPPKLRIVLTLKEYAELNYKEIGRILGISEGNVKVRVFRARDQLSKLLKEDEVYVP